MKAHWNKAVIAESDDTVIVEGNHYFPPDSVKTEFLRPSSHTTLCPWKGKAHYYDVIVSGDVNTNAAWYYPDTKPKAKQIRNYIAFWKGVEVSP